MAAKDEQRHDGLVSELRFLFILVGPSFCLGPAHRNATRTRELVGTKSVELIRVALVAVPALRPSVPFPSPFISYSSVPLTLLMLRRRLRVLILVGRPTRTSFVPSSAEFQLCPQSASVYGQLHISLYSFPAIDTKYSRAQRIHHLDLLGPFVLCPSLLHAALISFDFI